MQDSLAYLIRKFEGRANDLAKAIADGSCKDFVAYKTMVGQRKEALSCAQEVRDFIKKLNIGSI